MRKHWREIIVFSGAVSCLAVALIGLAAMTYWHHVSGSWLDERVTWWNPVIPVAIGGVFLFTRVVAGFLGV